MTEPVRACVRARARVLCAVRCALHVHVPFAWYSLLVAAGARLPADPCCSQRWRLTPRFASSSQAQCAGVAGAAIVAGAVAWPTSPPGLWRALVLWQLFYRFSAPSASLYWNVSRLYHARVLLGLVSKRIDIYSQNAILRDMRVRGFTPIRGAGSVKLRARVHPVYRIKPPIQKVTSTTHLDV